MDENLSPGGLEPNAPANPEPNQAEEPVSLPNTPEVQSGPDGQQPAADEFEDFEYDGKAYQVPKVLKPKLEQLGHMDAHFTKTSQANAATAKELAQERERIAQQAEATEAELDARAHLNHLNSQVKKLEELSWERWQQWDNEDPAAADQARKFMQYAQTEKTKLQGKISDAQNTRTQAAQSEMTTRIEETEKFARENIKGWTPDTNVKVLEFLKVEGVPDDFVVKNMSPGLYKIAHAAMIGMQVLKRQAASNGQAPQPPPLQVVGARSAPPATVDLAKASMEDYVAARKAGRKG